MSKVNSVLYEAWKITEEENSSSFQKQCNNNNISSATYTEYWIKISHNSLKANEAFKASTNYKSRQLKHTIHSRGFQQPGHKKLSFGNPMGDWDKHIRFTYTYRNLYSLSHAYFPSRMERNHFPSKYKPSITNGFNKQHFINSITCSRHHKGKNTISTRDS